jgi:transcriptional regulator with XRE-family HTH domain
MDFFDRVKALNKEKTNMTLKTFVESFGINYDTYNSGRRMGNLPRADETVKIAAALGVSVEYLVTGTDPDAAKPDTTPIIADLEHALDKLKKL